MTNWKIHQLGPVKSVIRPREIPLYMDIAFRVGEMSRANRKKVGAVIVKDGRILSMGWNGTPHGWDNACEDENGNTKPEVLHGESNAIMKLTKSTESSNGTSLFVTMAPCMECSKLIVQSGISEVFFNEIYRLTNGLEFLQKSGICLYRMLPDDEIIKEK